MRSPLWIPSAAAYCNRFPRGFPAKPRDFLHKKNNIHFLWIYSFFFFDLPVVFVNCIFPTNNYSIMNRSWKCGICFLYCKRCRFITCYLSVYFGSPPRQVPNVFSFSSDWCSALFRQAPREKKLFMMAVSAGGAICLRCRKRSSVNDLNCSKSA